MELPAPSIKNKKICPEKISYIFPKKKMLYFPIFFKFRDETFQIQAKKTNKQTNKKQIMKNCLILFFLILLMTSTVSTE